MEVQLTKEQMQTAKQLHQSGVTWSVVATYFNLSQAQLLKNRKHYDLQTTQ